MDIIKIKAEVYQLEQQGKRLPILHYLQDVWQQEPQSEGASSSYGKCAFISIRNTPITICTAGR